MLGAKRKVAWQTQSGALVDEASVSGTELDQPPTCLAALILRAAIKHGGGRDWASGPKSSRLPEGYVPLKHHHLGIMAVRAWFPTSGICSNLNFSPLLPQDPT